MKIIIALKIILVVLLVPIILLLISMWKNIDDIQKHIDKKENRND